MFFIIGFYGLYGKAPLNPMRKKLNPMRKKLNQMKKSTM